jgi:hypothetical protein
VSQKGKYIYGIVPIEQSKSLAIIGSDDPRKEIYTVPYQDISAVVSDSLIIDYNSMTKDRVVKELFSHQKVIEKVMENHTIIPMKFGTFAADEEEVLQILKTGHRRFRETVNTMTGRIELDVVALWNKELIFKEIAEESEIQEFKKRIASNPADPQLEDRIRLGGMVEKALKKRNLECAEEILCSLQEKASDLSAHETLDNTMILNASFLIDRDREKDFDEKLDELDEKYEGKINFRCVGPLPPYSFSTVEVKKIGFETIDKARRLLGLEERASRSEVKSAHRKLVFECHPDKNPQGGPSDNKFNELTQAYKILLEYCQSDRCSLRKEDVKDSILINILRIAEAAERKKFEKINLCSRDPY